MHLMCLIWPWRGRTIWWVNFFIFILLIFPDCNLIHPWRCGGFRSSMGHLGLLGGGVDASGTSIVMLHSTCWYWPLSPASSCISTRFDSQHVLLVVPSSCISHCIWHHLHCFCGSNHSRHFSTPSARPYGLLACFFNLMCSFQLRTCSHGYWDTSHHVRRCWQLFHSPECPWHLSMPLVSSVKQTPLYRVI